MQMDEYRNQLSAEVSKRNQFLSQTAKTGDEIRDLRSMLDKSLSTVSRDASPHRIDAEMRKLDEASAGSAASGSALPLSPSLARFRLPADQSGSSAALRLPRRGRSQTPVPFRRSLLRSSSPPVRGVSPRLASTPLPLAAAHRF